MGSGESALIDDLLSSEPQQLQRKQPAATATAAFNSRPSSAPSTNNIRTPMTDVADYITGGTGTISMLPFRFKLFLSTRLGLLIWLASATVLGLSLEMRSKSRSPRAVVSLK